MTEPKTVAAMLRAYVELIKMSRDYETWHYIPEVEQAAEAFERLTAEQGGADLRGVVLAHIADLRGCIPTLQSYRLMTTAAEMATAADELEAALTTQPQAEDIRAKLQDPVAVHVAMVRGEIARPPIRDVLHAYGAEALARWDAATPTAQPQAEPAERWVVVCETVLDVGHGDDVRTGGRPALGYALIAHASTYDSEDKARAVIRAVGLPLGWVLMPLSRLLPDIRAALATPTAPTEPT